MTTCEVCGRERGDRVGQCEETWLGGCPRLGYERATARADAAEAERDESVGARLTEAWTAATTAIGERDALRAKLAEADRELMERQRCAAPVEGNGACVLWLGHTGRCADADGLEWTATDQAHFEIVAAVEKERDEARAALAQSESKIASFEAAQQRELEARKRDRRQPTMNMCCSGYVWNEERRREAESALATERAGAATFRDWAAGWFVCLYDSLNVREGYEATGLTEDEAISALGDILANMGCHAGTGDPAQVAESRRLLALDLPHSPPTDAGRALLAAVRLAWDVLNRDACGEWPVGYDSKARREQALAALDAALGGKHA